MILLRKITLSFLVLLFTFTLTHAQDGYSSASFSISKQRAERKHIPQPAEIRVEEYMNYHRHNIKLPEEGESVAVDLSWGRPAVADGNFALLQIGLSTSRLPKSFERPSLNLALVIDRSGSMQGDKMAKTKEALRTLVRQLHPQDQVSLVVFDHVAEVWVPAQRRKDGYHLFDAIDQLEARGSTDLNAGITLGYQEALRNFSPAQSNRVIILTDALTNSGELDPRAIVRNTQYYDQDRQVDFVLIGVGQDFNHDLSRNLTDQQGLTLHFIHDAEDIRKVFEEEVASLIAPVAKKVWLEIRYPESYGPLTFFGYHAEQTPGRITLPLNDMNCELTQVFLLGFPLYDRGKGGDVEIELQYFDLNEQRTVSRLYSSGIPYHPPYHPLEKAEVAKNHSIAVMAQGMKNMATLHAKGNTQEAITNLEKVIHDVYAAFPQGLDSDQKRVMDILEAYQKDLVVFLDRG